MGRVQAVRVCVTQAVRVRVTSPSSWDGEAGATCGLPVCACAGRGSPPLHVDSQVLIAAPRDAASHLLYQSSATCTGMGEAVFYRQPLRSHAYSWTGVRQRRKVDNDGECCRLRYGRRHLL